MKLSNNAYNFFKWALLIVAPAFVALLTTVGTIYGFDFTKETALITAITTFLGVAVGVSNIQYNASEEAGDDQ